MNDTESELDVDTLCAILNCENLAAEDTSTDGFWGGGSGSDKSISITEEKLNALRSELNGATLNVTFLDDYPLSYLSQRNGTTGQGVAFHMLDFLAEKLNFSYQLIKPQRNIMGSSAQYEGSIFELLDKGIADMAVSFLPVMTNPDKHMFYSSATLDEGEWMMLMRRPQESASGSGLLAPFSVDVWILILVSLVFVGPILYFIILIRMRLTRDKSQKLYPLPHCVWFVYGALMKQGSVLSPIGDSVRLLFATWWIFITILTAFYTANLTAFLTLSQFTLPINSPDDILSKEKKFVAHEGGAVEYAIKNTNETLVKLSRMVDKNLAAFVDTYNDTEVLVDYVEKNNFVFVRDRPAIKHLIYNDYKYRRAYKADDEKVHCAFAISKEPFLRRRRSFAYSQNFHFQQLFDYELLHLVEAGIVKYLLLENIPKPEICPNNLSGKERQLRNGDLMMTYYIMIAGFCTSIVVFVTEMIFKFLNYHQSKKVQQLDSSYGRDPGVIATKKSESFVSSISPPPPYTTIFSRHRIGTDSLTPKLPSGLSRDEREMKNHKVINGRDYMVVKELGVTRLIPMRVPSAALFQYRYTE